MEGFFILFEDHYAVGDIVTIQGITGTVESVTLRFHKAARFRRRCAYHPEWLYRYGHQ